MSRSRFDTVLTAAVAVLVLAVVGFAGYFGYTVYRDKQAAEDATPALRVVKVAQAQVKATPNDAVARVRLAEALAAVGRQQEAISQLNAAIKINPQHIGAYLDLGLLARQVNKPAQAQQYFQKVVDLTSGSDYQDVNQYRETAFYNLGLLAYADKRYDDAIGSFKAALRIRNDASDTYYYLARALYMNDEVDGAIQNIRTAITFDPNFAQAHYFLGDLYMAKKDKINASYEYYKAASISPDAPEPKQALAKFGTPAQLIAQARSEATTNVAAALDTILIARNVDPENAEAAILHGEILVKKQAWKDALDVYQQAAKLSPKDQSIQDTIKWLTPKVPKPASSK
jgi:tetratricopeptide (TPR) repeat protein